MTAWTPLASAAVVLLIAGGPGAGAAAEETARPGPSASIPPVRVVPLAPDIDLRRLRDIFRYADEPSVDDGPGRAMVRPSVTEPTEASPPVPRARLVGLVERGGRRAAALLVDGEVVVLGEGESAGGLTVLGVDDETVRLRGPEGVEEALPLP